jgi:phosphatidylethanolamine/phosphatidyl-N-methylethanolamine N-methyltransferase
MISPGRDRAAVTLSPPDRGDAIYEKLAPLYDVIYGAALEPGRRRAMVRLSPIGGESILEVGVGTAHGARGYPPTCQVTAVDLSAHMLARAKRRLQRWDLRHVTLCRMDATRLAFPDATFDAVYAPYVVNVVHDPALAAREMLRVCRPGGRLVLLNHFRRDGHNRAADRMVGVLAQRVSGVNWGLDLATFLRETGLRPRCLESANLLGVSSIIVCYKPDATPPSVGAAKARTSRAG